MSMINSIGTLPRGASTSDAPGLTDEQQQAIDAELQIWHRVGEIIQNAVTALQALRDPSDAYNHEKPSDLAAIFAQYKPNMKRAERLITAAMGE